MMFCLCNRAIDKGCILEDDISSASGVCGQTEPIYQPDNQTLILTNMCWVCDVDY